MLGCCCRSPGTGSYRNTGTQVGNICKAVHCTARTLERIQVVAALCTHGRTVLKNLAVKKPQARWLQPHTAGCTQAGTNETSAAADPISHQSTTAMPVRHRRKERDGRNESSSHYMKEAKRRHSSEKLSQISSKACSRNNDGRYNHPSSADVQFLHLSFAERWSGGLLRSLHPSSDGHGRVFVLV